MKAQNIKTFQQAEEYLYNEMSIVLDMSFNDVKDYVTNRLLELEEIK